MELPIAIVVTKLDSYTLPDIVVNYLDPQSIQVLRIKYYGQVHRYSWNWN